MRHQRPPVSAALLLGMALAPLPMAAAEPLFKIAASAITNRHPGIFGRVPGDLSILIDPLELPWRFVLHPGRTPPSLALVGRDTLSRADATIRARLAVLIDLLEGRVDGDAVFFSRDLMIEGNTEAVVALRNAIDGAEIRVVEDTLAALGPLAGIASRACHRVVSLVEAGAARAERILETVDAPRSIGA